MHPLASYLLLYIVVKPVLTITSWLVFWTLNKPVRRGALPWLVAAATLKELWSPDAADGEYRDEMAVATYIVQVASHVARELQEELCQAEAIRFEILL